MVSLADIRAGAEMKCLVKMRKTGFIDEINSSRYVKILFSLLVFMVVAISARADVNGRFAVVPAGEFAFGVWIIDTQNGEAKFCFRTPGIEGAIVECTPPAFVRSGTDRPKRYVNPFDDIWMPAPD